MLGWPKFLSLSNTRTISKHCPTQFFPRGTKDWVQDLRHAWQDFTHWVISLAPENDSLLFKAIFFHTFKQLILYTYPETPGTINYNDLTIDWGTSLSPEDAGPESPWNSWTKGWKSQLHIPFRSLHLPATVQACHRCLSLIRRNKTKKKIKKPRQTVESQVWAEFVTFCLLE